MAHGRMFQILAIGTELLPDMLDAGFNDVFVVEPAYSQFGATDRAAT
jgi:hypothetical protein